MAHVISVAAGGTASSLTTGAVNTTGANTLLLIANSDPSTTVSSISDSYGNTWIALTGNPLVNVTNTWGYYAKNAIVGTGHTFSFAVSNTTNHITLAVSAFSGRGVVSPIDAQSTFSTTTYVQSQSGGTLTANSGDDLWEGAIDVSNQNSDTFTAGSGWTIGASALSPGNNYQPVMVQYKNGVASGSASGPYSTVNFVQTGGFIVAIQAAAAAQPSPWQNTGAMGSVIAQ